MKTTLKSFLLMVGIALTVVSCSKEEIPTVSDLDSSIEILARTPNPGTYVVGKFIDNGEDQTSQFGQYTFQFQADVTLIATTDTGEMFTGTYFQNADETILTIVIDGNDALVDLSGEYNVERISNKRIRLSSTDGTTQLLSNKVD